MAESALELLERKNKHLEDEIQTCRELFSNLTEEKGIESRDDRRTFMLKAQVYQLERQCMLLAQAQSSRAHVLGEIESQLQRITDDLRSIVSEEKSGPNVTLKRAQVMDLIGTLKKLKNSLYKQSQLECADNLRIPSLMSGSKYAANQKLIDCLDICSKTPSDNINLKQISVLERDLSSLYKRLCCLATLLNGSALCSHSFSEGEDLPLMEKQFLSPIFERVQRASEDCVSGLKHCCQQLTEVSLLHPSAPWSILKTSSQFDSLKLDKIMHRLPSFAQKIPQIRSTAQDIQKAHNYICYMHALKENAMEEEMSYYRATAKIQHQYLLELSSSVINDYSAWKESTVDGICKPVSTVLQSWSILKENQSSENLKKFLADFKKCETELEELTMMHSSSERQKKMFSSLTKRLNDTMNSLEKEYSSKIAKAEEALKKRKDSGP